jgi:hypothetical protein
MYERIPEEAMVWVEAQVPRWKWQWWGWRKIEPKSVPMSRYRMFMQIAAAPLIMQGARFRARPAERF